MTVGSIDTTSTSDTVCLRAMDAIIPHPSLIIISHVFRTAFTASHAILAYLTSLSSTRTQSMTLLFTLTPR